MTQEVARLLLLLLFHLSFQKCQKWNAFSKFPNAVSTCSSRERNEIHWIRVSLDNKNLTTIETWLRCSPKNVQYTFRYATMPTTKDRYVRAHVGLYVCVCVLVCCGGGGGGGGGTVDVLGLPLSQASTCSGPGRFCQYSHIMRVKYAGCGTTWKILWAMSSIHRLLLFDIPLPKLPSSD